MLKRLRKYIDQTKVLREVGSYDALGLVYAVESGNRECLNILIGAGMDVNATNERGTPALSRAVEKENLPVIRILMEAGANVNATDPRGRTPLMKAIESGNNHVFDFILDQEPELESSDDLGETALFKAVREGNTTMARKLIQAGSEVELRNREGLTPLLLAVSHQRVGIVKALLQAGADPNATDAQGRTALDRNGGLSPRLIRMLRRAGIERRREGESSTYTDFSATLSGAPTPAQVLSKLIGGFIHSMAQTLNMQDVVEEVEFKGREILSQLDLPKSTFSFNGKNGSAHNGHPPQQQEEWVLQMLAYMREIGQLLQQLAQDGYGAYMAPPEAIQSDLLKLLDQYTNYLRQQPPRPKPEPTREQEPDPVRQEQLNQALQQAARIGSTDLIRTLLDLGADVHATDAHGQSPLHLAVGHPLAVSLLLKAGADPDQADIEGHTPADLARQENQPESLAQLDPHAAV
ncbi:MAG: ankyrin repeat domain-containing protein [Bacteroidetes bacterium]|nr:MAG: ankyrin repeat domain-containing protein [Bacteroidota bacterium]